MDMWLLWLLHCASSLFYADVLAVNISVTEITPLIYVSPKIENIFRAHCFNLTMAASEYERTYGRSTVITQLYKDMYRKRLSELLIDNQDQVREICAQEELQQVFIEACKKTADEADIDERIGSWTAFVGKVYERQHEARKARLPDIWFPEHKHKANETEFMKRNAGLVLDQSQCSAVVVNKLITFFPFAVIENYDKEVFKVFVEARDLVQH